MYRKKSGQCEIRGGDFPLRGSCPDGIIFANLNKRYASVMETPLKRTEAFRVPRSWHDLRFVTSLGSGIAAITMQRRNRTGEVPLSRLYKNRSRALRRPAMYYHFRFILLFIELTQRRWINDECRWNRP